MDISEKLTAIAENQLKVFDAGKLEQYGVITNTL